MRVLAMTLPSNWVIMVIVLGSTLWMSPSKLCGIFKTLLILVIVALAFVLLKEGVYVKRVMGCGMCS